jgi:hypothetical protein
MPGRCPPGGGSSARKIGLNAQLSASAHPIDDAGYQKIDTEKFNQKIQKIKPTSADKLEGKNRYNCHGGKTSDRIKGVEITLRYEPRQKEHTDI